MTGRIAATITLDLDQLRELLLSGGINLDRESTMVREYGEAMSLNKAASAIGVGYDTIKRMLADGRVLAACEGTKVDTRSLARYIEHRGEYDHRGRMLRKEFRGMKR